MQHWWRHRGYYDDGGGYQAFVVTDG